MVSFGWGGRGVSVKLHNQSVMDEWVGGWVEWVLEPWSEWGVIVF